MNEKTHPPSKDNSTLNNDAQIISNLLLDDINFDLLIILLIYQELTLKEMCNLISKKKSTIHRHIQNLIHNGLLIESKEEKPVRGSINTKYYSINYPKLLMMPQYSLEQIQSLAPVQRQEIYRQIQQSYLIILSFMQKVLNGASKYLQNLHVEDERTFLKLINMVNPTFILSLTLQNEEQKTLYFQRLSEFNQKLIQEFQDRGMLNILDMPSQAFPFLSFFTIIPMKDILPKPE